MRAEGHFHVDVFAGPAERFVRGFTLQSDEDGRWVVFDDVGLTGRTGSISDPLPAREALRLALAKLHGLLEKPLRPVWGGAPFESLGYTRPTLWAALRAVFLRRRIPSEVVGPDGLAARG
jgi:hypothetical protein